MIELPKDREFNIEFIKRTTGELRQMRVQLPGEFSEEEVASSRLLAVYDLDSNRFKTIALEGIKRVLIDGTWIQFSSDASVGGSEHGSEPGVHQQV